MLRAPSNAAGPLTVQLLLALALAFALPAPGRPQAPTPETALQVKGSDTIGGSLGPALARAFEASHDDARVEWESLGSGTAFVGLFDGTADLGASSRRIKGSEMAEAGRLGIRLKEYVLGYDGIAVLVHPSNPVGELTLRQVSDLFAGEIESWRELGGPDRPVRVLSRPSYSGTHGFFKEVALRLGGAAGEREFGPATEWVEHSEDLVRRVASDPDAVTYLGMGWIGPGVKALSVAPARGARAVAPNLESVRDGSYPVYRPLLLYTRGEPAGELRDLVRFILSEPGQAVVEEQGFIAADVTGVIARTALAEEPREEDDPALVRVRFPTGGTALSAESRAALDRLVRRTVAALRSGTETRVLVVGHADSSGTAAVNLRVSLARAGVVADYLAARGVPRARMVVEGRGSEQPVATNESLEGRRQNRRVDVRLIRG